MSRKITILLMVLAMGFVLGGLGGCETEKAYTVCELDKEVTSKNICSGSSGASSDSSTSCVVRLHPHCPDNVCLSYFSRQAICTHACTGDGDCHDDGILGTCWEFAGAAGGKPADRYCVPPDDYYEKLVAE